jgi:hypothetical protein
VQRPSAALIVTVVALLLTGCSGGSEGGSGSADETSPVAPPGGSLEALWRAGGESVTTIAGTSDHGVGRNRISFLIADSNGSLVEQPTAKVWFATAKTGKPFATATARLEAVGVPGGSEADAQFIYVVNARAPSTGTLWYVVAPAGSAVRALGSLRIRARPAAPAVGDRAVASKTPTIRSTGGDLAKLSTSKKPDRALYQVSVAEALAAREPFLVTFATPQFCQTRVCGPVVEVVSAARRRLAGSDLQFIHVEIYEDNNPGAGVNRWVKEWKLPTEPYTFVVDRKGIVRASFEGAASVTELVAAARRVA